MSLTAKRRPIAPKTSATIPVLEVTEQGLDVYVDLELSSEARCDVSVEIATVSGITLFKTLYSAGTLPAGRVTVRLTLPRLGLGDGAHVLTATAWSAGLPPHALSKSLVVAPHPSGLGLIRPEHAWSTEPRSEPVPAPPAAKATAQA